MAFRTSRQTARRATCVAAAALTAAVVLVPSGPVGAAPESFYSYSGSVPLSQLKPGTVLKTREVAYHLAGITLPLKVTQLLYRSTNARGQAIANPTSVIHPPVSIGTPRVVAYQSFYDSLNPEDGPSRAIANDTAPSAGSLLSSAETALIVPQLLQGFTVVVADTEGPAADFAAGPTYGTTTLDSLRAASASSAAGIGTTSRIGLLGYSGGAIGTNWTAALAPSYAPEIDRRLVGAAEGGVLVDPDHNLGYIEGTPVWAGVAAMALVGVARAYDVSVEPYLNDYGKQVEAKLQNASIAQVLGAYPGLTWKQIAKPAYPTPQSVPVYRTLVNRVNLGSRPSPRVPMFVGQGANGTLEATAGLGKGDGVMVAGDVRSLARQYCRDGVAVTYREYPLTSHVTSVPAFATEANAWLTSRFSGAAAGNNCASIAPGNSLTPLPPG